MYEAIRALEQVGDLSWVNRITRVREYVPRPVRQPGARRCAEPGRQAARRVAQAKTGPCSRRPGQDHPEPDRRQRAACDGATRPAPIRPVNRVPSFETTPPPI